MNSVMEIGDNIMFLHKGNKLWEGGREEIMDTTVPELKEFIFASSLMRAAKKVEEELGSFDAMTTQQVIEPEKGNPKEK
jgi:phospholipid/cholesterol/gamma-HCH transport system ATP-binding protein